MYMWVYNVLQLALSFSLSLSLSLSHTHTHTHRVTDTHHQLQQIGRTRSQTAALMRQPLLPSVTPNSPPVRSVGKPLHLHTSSTTPILPSPPSPPSHVPAVKHRLHDRVHVPVVPLTRAHLHPHALRT